MSFPQGSYGEVVRITLQDGQKMIGTPGRLNDTFITLRPEEKVIGARIRPVKVLFVNVNFITSIEVYE